MNFKQKIDYAIKSHKEATNEIVTPTYIAEILWPKSNPKTQRSLFSQHKRKDKRLSTDQVLALKKCFHSIPISFWLGNDKVIKALDVFRAKYTIDETTKNVELGILWGMLNNDLYPETLVDKYLTDETLTCEGWNMSNCCGAKLEFTDICADCKEHSDTQCSDCEIYNECNNENKPNLD